MKITKDIRNRILNFRDRLCTGFKKESAGRQRLIVLLFSVLVLLIVLVLILSISSCHASGEAEAEDPLAADTRTRVRATIPGETAAAFWSEAQLRVSSDAHAVTGPVGAGTTWPPDEEPPALESTEIDDPESTPDPTAQGEGTAQTPAPEDPEGTPDTKETYVSLKKHDKSDAVTELQNRLMELGYLDIDEPTNYFGTITETALVLFQRQHDLKQDGIAGNETQSLLFSDSAQHYLMKEGAEGEDVEALQEQLVDLGYLSEKDVDRVYGPVTLAAVEAFQKRNGLHVDGLAGEKTLEMLYSDEAKISRELQKQQEEEKKPTATPKPTPTKKPGKTSSGKKTPTPKPTKKATATPKKDTRIDKFIAAAKSKIGCEYVLGAKGPNKFDCSGLIYWCLKQAGVEGTRLNALGYSRKSGWKLIENMNSLKKGDILFFRSDNDRSVNHTGIYVGGGTMIDASSGNGKVVKRAISAYFKRNFVCARRPWRE